MGSENRPHKDCKSFVALLKSRSPSDAVESLKQVKAGLAPLTTLLHAWRDYLLSEKNPSLITRCNQRVIKNACGSYLMLAAYPNVPELKRKASCHVLQGLEAAYIHNLCVLSKAHGFRPVSNQHDGIVTIGQVPDAAHQEAMHLAGMRYGILIEKPFV